MDCPIPHRNAKSNNEKKNQRGYFQGSTATFRKCGQCGMVEKFSGHFNDDMKKLLPRKVFPVGRSVEGTTKA